MSFSPYKLKDYPNFDCLFRRNKGFLFCYINVKRVIEREWYNTYIGCISSYFEESLHICLNFIREEPTKFIPEGIDIEKGCGNFSTVSVTGNNDFYSPNDKEIILTMRFNLVARIVE